MGRMWGGVLLLLLSLFMVVGYLRADYPADAAAKLLFFVVFVSAPAVGGAIPGLDPLPIVVIPPSACPSGMTLACAQRVRIYGIFAVDTSCPCGPEPWATSTSRSRRASGRRL
jgi:hypothetical protein